MGHWSPVHCKDICRLSNVIWGSFKFNLGGLRDNGGFRTVWGITISSTGFPSGQKGRRCPRWSAQPHSRQCRNGDSRCLWPITADNWTRYHHRDWGNVLNADKLESLAYLSLCYLSLARALPAYAECLFIMIKICELTRRTDICNKRMNAVEEIPSLCPPSTASLSWEWIPWQQNQFAAWGPFVGVLLFMWYDLCFTFPEVSTDTETRSSETWSTVSLSAAVKQLPTWGWRGY